MKKTEISLIELLSNMNDKEIRQLLISAFGKQNSKRLTTETQKKQVAQYLENQGWELINTGKKIRATI